MHSVDHWVGVPARSLSCLALLLVELSRICNVIGRGRLVFRTWISVKNPATRPQNEELSSDHHRASVNSLSYIGLLYSKVGLAYIGGQWRKL